MSKKPTTCLTPCGRSSFPVKVTTRSIVGKSSIASIALVLLSGCATVGDLRKGQPASVLSGSKPVADVAACVTGGWMQLATSLSPADVRALPRPNNGTTILLNNPATNAPIAFADIDRIGNVTTTTYYRQGNFSVNDYFARVDRTVHQCAR